MLVAAVEEEDLRGQPDPLGLLVPLGLLDLLVPLDPLAQPEPLGLLDLLDLPGLLGAAVVLVALELIIT